MPRTKKTTARPKRRGLSAGQNSRVLRHRSDVFDEITAWAVERMPFLKSAETKETFFKRIAQFLPPLDPRFKMIERAYEAAKDAHRGVLRSDGTRYFEHVRAVTLIIIEYLRVRDVSLIIAALLHDVVEDNHTWTIERVRAEFGEREALLVQYLTKPNLREVSSERDRDRIYHARFAFAPRDFFLIKLPDRFHNLITLRKRSAKKRLNKIRETRRHYMPCAEKHLILFHELTKVLQLLEQGV